MSTPTAAEVFTQVRKAGEAVDINAYADLFAEDGEIHWPKTLPGRPHRIQGRENIRTFFLDAVADLPERVIEYHDVVLHETTDPEVVIAEYEAHTTVLGTGKEYRLPFVVVLTVRDGKIARYRDYMPVSSIPTGPR